MQAKADEEASNPRPSAPPPITPTARELEIIAAIRATGGGGRVVVITEREADLLTDLRKVDAFKAGKQRIITVQWNGAKAFVFVGQQV